MLGVYILLFLKSEIKMKSLLFEADTFVPVKENKYCHSVVTNIASIIHDDLFYLFSHTQNNKLQR